METTVASRRRRYYIVVTPFFPTPYSFRGPFIYDQVKAIKKVRPEYEVIVFKESRDRHCNEYEYGGIKVYEFYARQTPSYLFNGLFNKSNTRRFINRFKQLGINPSEVLVAHCHTSQLGAYGLGLKELNSDIQVLLQHHDKDPYTILNGKFAGWRPNVRYRARKSIDIFEKVDGHLCVSGAVEANLLAFPGASEHETYQPYLDRLKKVDSLKTPAIKKSMVLYNGVDCSKFAPAENKRHNDIFTIGNIANFISWKKQDELIKAFAIWHKSSPHVKKQLRLVGSGPELNHCKSLAVELGIDDLVSFEPEVDHNYLSNFYNSIDLFVLPSHFEGFGCVATEAAACGVPFIIPHYQGAAEYITSEQTDLWTYTPGDIKALANLIGERFRDHRSQHLIYSLDIMELIEDFLECRNI